MPDWWSSEIIVEEEIKNSLSGVVYQRMIAGKGVLDSADKAFETHVNDKWHDKIEKLVTAGHLTPDQAATEKISD